MRTRIATDLHDDIGANLTRIALLSEVAKLELRDRGPNATPGALDDESDDGPLRVHLPHRQGVGRFDERHRLGDQPLP